MRRAPARCGRFAALLTALLLAVPGSAEAVIPSAQKIQIALAENNAAARRAEPLWLEVNLRIGDGDVVGSGVLVSHPTGLARLELRGPGGLVERHLLQGNEYLASRDGELLRDPRPFLPPFYLLQVTSEAEVAAALSGLGANPEEVMLGRFGETDCYVLGGRPVPPPEDERKRQPSLWIDMDSLEPVRVDWRNGIRFEFGPMAVFDGIRLPQWFSIESPGRDPVRLEVLKAALADAPASAFRKSWLEQP